MRRDETPLDPQVQAVLEQRGALPPPGTLSVEEYRALKNARPRSPGPEVAKVEDRLIPGAGVDIPIRVYTPFGVGPFRALVWFHGGGWVVGNLDTADETSRYLAAGGECVVVSVDYRLAPEAKFPAAAEDCFTATTWVTKSGPMINVAPASVAVGGDSAGGNLATAVALMARDKGEPSLAFQLMVYPVTERNFSYPSYEQNGVYGLSREAMIWYWEQYLQHEGDATNPYAAPMQAKDLRGLPPALVITAEFDPLRDEGEAYAERLRQAGVPTTYTCYDGMVHGFFGMSGMVDKASQAVSQASAALKAAFAR